MKKNFLIALIMLTTLQTQAFEECIITTDGKLTDIKIENNQVVDIYPLITIMNDRNTLFVKPLKEGETSFSILKNGKNIYKFDIKISENKTEISEEKGFQILTLDAPPQQYEIELDTPPQIKEGSI